MKANFNEWLNLPPDCTVNVKADTRHFLKGNQQYYKSTVHTKNNTVQWDILDEAIQQLKIGFVIENSTPNCTNKIFSIFRRSAKMYKSVFKIDFFHNCRIIQRDTFLHEIIDYETE